MKTHIVGAILLAAACGGHAYHLTLPTFARRASTERMSASSEFVGKYTGEKKLQKVEAIKDRSNYLRDPLQSEMGNDEIFVNGDAVVVLKYHGSYMQDNRENRKKGEEKEYSFMLRLKSPAGEIPADLYR